MRGRGCGSPFSRGATPSPHRRALLFPSLLTVGSRACACARELVAPRALRGGGLVAPCRGGGGNTPWGFTGRWEEARVYKRTELLKSPSWH